MAKVEPPRVTCVLRAPPAPGSRVETTFWDVRNGWEHASILVRSARHDAGDPDKERTSIELMIRSSYGSWGHYWSHAGGDWRSWLDADDFHYTMGKLAGTAFKVHMDMEECVREAKRWLKDYRRSGQLGISKDDVRKLWDGLYDFDRDWPKDTFFALWDQAAEGLPYRHQLYEIGFDKPDPSLRQFWDTLWTPFCAHINALAKAEAA